MAFRVQTGESILDHKCLQGSCFMFQDCLEIIKEKINSLDSNPSFMDLAIPFRCLWGKNSDSSCCGAIS